MDTFLHGRYVKGLVSLVDLFNESLQLMKFSLRIPGNESKLSLNLIIGGGGTGTEILIQSPLNVNLRQRCDIDCGYGVEQVAVFESGYSR